MGARVVILKRVWGSDPLDRLGPGDPPWREDVGDHPA
jgi:hypothetical protein